MSNIRIVLTLDGKQYEAQLNKAEAGTRKLGDSAVQTGTQLSLMSTAMRAVGVSLSAFTGFQVLRAISDVDIQFQKMRLALEAVSDGSIEAARQFNFVSSEAERLGVDLQTAAQGYTFLAASTRGTALEGAATEKIFSAVAEAAATMSLSVADTNGVFRALQQIASKGTLSAEELRQQLGDRLPRSFQIAAEAMGVTTAELNEMLQRGEIMSNEFLPKFAAAMRKNFGTDSTTQIDTTAAAFTRLSNQFKVLGDSIGDRLNPKLQVAADLLARMLKVSNDFNAQGPAGSQALGGGKFVLESGAIFDSNAWFQKYEGVYTGGQPGVKAPFRAGPYEALAGIGREYGGLPNYEPIFYGAAMDAELNDKQKEKIELLREERALLGMITNEQKVLYQVTQGQFRHETWTEKGERLDIARARDEIERRTAATKDAEKADKAWAQEQERLLKIEQERNAEADELIQNARDRRGVMEEEQRLGRAMTESEQALFDLRNGGYDHLLPAQKESWRLELEKNAALERQGLAVEELAVAYMRAGTFMDGMAVATQDYIRYATDTFRQGAELVDTFYGSLEDTMVNALQTGKFAWRDFGDVVVAEIQRIAVQTMLAGLTRQFMGLRGRSASTNAGAGFVIPDGVISVDSKHTGGIVGVDRSPLRNVPASAFAGAPRFHGGGMIGGDEVPIIARRGEGVFTPEQMKAMGGTRVSVNVGPTNIDARNATPEMLPQLRRLGMEIEERTKASVFEAIRRGTNP